MKLITIFSFLILSFQASAHCPMTFKNSNLCAGLTWTDGPNLNQTSSFEIMFWKKGDSNHEPVSPAFDINIYSWMIMANGHNHGGPLFDTPEVSTGIFKTEEARFFMHGMQGYWEIRVDLTDTDGNTETEATRVNF